MQAGTPRHVVILMHGTWGRGLLPWSRRRVAAWCEPGSPLCEAVAAVLGPDVAFEPLSWRGSNSAKARLEAAAALTSRIEAWHRDHPSTQIHIIAHSHAGNVAMYALRDAAVAPLVGSLACLSTPFLHCRPRELGARLALPLEFVVRFGLALLPPVLFTAGVATYWAIFGPTSVHVVWAGVMAAMASVVVWQKVPGVLRGLHSYSHQRAKEMRLPSSLAAPTLLVRDSRDEASLALTAAQVCSTLVTRLLRVVLGWIPAAWMTDVGELMASSQQPSNGTLLGLTRTPPDPSPPLRRLWPPILVGAALFATSFAMIAKAQGLSRAFASSMDLLIVVGLVVGSLVATGWQELQIWWVFVLGPPCVWLLLVLAAVALAPFGVELPLFAIGLEMSTEATPPGVWELHQIGLPRVSLEERPLRHSTQENPEVLAVLTAWLYQRFGDGCSSSREELTALPAPRADRRSG